MSQIFNYERLKWMFFKAKYILFPAGESLLWEFSDFLIGLDAAKMCRF